LASASRTACESEDPAPWMAADSKLPASVSYERHSRIYGRNLNFGRPVAPISTNEPIGTKYFLTDHRTSYTRIEPNGILFMFNEIVQPLLQPPRLGNLLLPHQHSAHIEPGRDGLFNLIKSIPPTLRYEPGVIAAEGDFVIVHGRFSGFGLPIPL
jgi:hypothetical protein